MYKKLPQECPVSKNHIKICAEAFEFITDMVEDIVL